MGSRQGGRGESPVNTFALPVVGVAGSTGVFASAPNPVGAAIIVHRAVLRVTTASAAASTLDIGIAANGTTSADNLLDGISAAAAGVFDSVNDTDNGTNGVAKSQVMTASQFVTVAEASGNVDALIGTVYVTYHLA